MHNQFVQKEVGSLSIKLSLHKLMNSAVDVFNVATGANTHHNDLNDAYFLLDQIKHDKVYFVREPWYGPYTDTLNIKELLIRAFDHKDQGRLLNGLQQLKSAGYEQDIDRLLIACELENALKDKDFPISLNLSIRSAVSEKFWESISPYLAKASGKTDQIVFELLECPDMQFIGDISDEDLKVLKTQKEKWGFQIAIDDYDSVPNDIIRLRKFSALTDFVKLDGQRYLEKKSSDPGKYVKGAINDIHAVVPGAGVVVEWVENAAESKKIFDANSEHIVFVQSKEIRPVSLQKEWQANRTGAYCVFPRFAV